MNLPSHWYIIARSVEVKSKKPWAVMRFGIPLVMWRDSQGELVVMEDRCPHRFAQLSLGELKDGQLECPFHGFQFDAQGNCQWVPELGRAVPKLCVKTFRIIERAGWIWMWWGRAEPTQEAPEFFSQVDESPQTTLKSMRKPCALMDFNAYLNRPTSINPLSKVLDRSITRK